MIAKNVAKEKNTVTFDVELDAAEFEKYVNAAYLKNRSRISVPGFRKGKAPRKVIEGMYGVGVFYEDAFDDAAQVCFNYAVEQEKLRLVGRPSMTGANITEGKGAVLSFSTDVWPVAELGQYKELTAVKPSVEVKEEEVTSEVERLRKQNARLITVEGAASEGDTVNIDFLGTLEGVPFDGGTAEGYSLVLGSNSFVPGFEEQVVGMSAGEEKDIDITFPEDYSAELAGKAVVFHVKCNEVKHEDLPEADDEFAKDNGYDTLDEMKAGIQKNIEDRKNESSDRAFGDALVDKAASNMNVEIPASMIEERIDSMVNEYGRYFTSSGFTMDKYLEMTGSNMSTFRENMRPAAEKQARTEILLGAVAEAENFEISDEVVEAEYAQMAESYKMDVETVKAAVDAASIKDDIARRMAMDIIKSTGIAEEKAE